LIAAKPTMATRYKLTFGAREVLDLAKEIEKSGKRFMATCVVENQLDP
jgi:hypothetical protein